MRLFQIFVIVILNVSTPAQAAFGTEVLSLLKLIAGQVKEIEALTAIMDQGKEQNDYLLRLNQGIEQTVDQIEAVQAVVDHTQGLDPQEVQSLSDLNDLMRRTQAAKKSVDELLLMKFEITDRAIEKSGLQSETTYQMGQEMVATGSSLSNESRNASPGRASQITAAATSAQMLSEGVVLQTLSQMVQLQALTLELQKSQMESSIRTERSRRVGMEQELRLVSRNRGRR